MRVLITCLAVLIFGADSAQGCAKYLFAENTNIRLVSSETLESFVQIEFKDGRTLSCQQFPRRQKRLVRRMVDLLNAKKEWSIADLINRLDSPWKDLSMGAGLSVLQRVKQQPSDFEATDAQRISGIVNSDSLELTTARLLIRSLRYLPSPLATESLTEVLTRNGNTKIKLMAANALGKLDSMLAGSVLRRCVDREDMMLKSQCERSLIRWQAHQTVPTKHSTKE